jgi:hypothetical protein
MVVPKKKELKLATAKESKVKSKNRSRISWARLLKSEFKIDVRVCNKRNDKMKIISAVEVVARPA